MKNPKIEELIQKYIDKAQGIRKEARPDLAGNDTVTGVSEKDGNYIAATGIVLVLGIILAELEELGEV